ncbi:MAG: hypothetical protein CVV64_08675 [Candidatus Wallbacteria bacterium HGW-Wallbacteria-1]|jgi:hypothetical protein|uniref:Uncharacterized protein n=1 Tax=Candidatus Wallbacteria bacterium HGW-Wallbacteria-1 TaxID=2013854 RepID=A0A2N1PQ17_9BACT|nr:MAG: hypothetical protein CVV64_08675 [Candidatus Wallbacteria bacterium HGW-Wallbacteria-1]
MAKETTMIERFKNLDRRIIFTLVAIAVIIPLLRPIGLKTDVTKEVKDVYDRIEKLQAGERVLLSFEYDPASKPEIHPMAIAITHHLLNKGVKIAVVALWPMGSEMADQVFELMKADSRFGHKFEDDGTTWVNLGYKAGGPTVIKLAGSKFQEAFPGSKSGVPFADIKILRGVKSISDFKMILSFSAGDPGLKQWVQIANAQYGVDVAGGVTAVSAPEFYPYYNSNQMFGILGGLKAAAEYEALIGVPGKATSGMDAQSVVHLVIIGFILFANAVYFIERKQMKGVE